MKTIIYQALPADLFEPVWNLYAATFEPLRTLAVQRHVMHPDEYDQVMNDPRIDKYVTTDDDGRPVGIGAQTTHLDAVDLIEPQFFAAHWPDLYYARKIWYVMFIGATQDPARVPGIFAEQLDRMSEPTDDAHGITCLDYCLRNVIDRDMPRVTGLILRRVRGRTIPISRLDEQSYWLYDFRRA